MEATAQLELQTARLDEPALRRPDFQPGQTVILADGQGWTLPCPKVCYKPVRLPDGQWGSETESSFGPAFQALVEELEVAETVGAESLAFIEVAVDLLSRNYHLDDAQFQILLRYQPGDDQTRQTVLAVYRIASGFGVVTVPNASAA